MQDWEKALDQFLETWKPRDEVVGALVCGSFVTGNPKKHSDIDLHIILREGTDWRERGNKVIGGFLIEYFANPPCQIHKYFEEDFEANKQMNVTQFLTGKVLFDDGSISRLQEEAAKWHAKDRPKLPSTSVEIMKYGIWDLLDNLRDALEQDEHFWHLYHVSLDRLLSKFCRFKGYPDIKAHRVADVLEGKSLKKYLLPEFPDKRFQSLFLHALRESDKEKALERYEQLTEHVLQSMSGFEIDGWKMRSPISC